LSDTEYTDLVGKFGQAGADDRIEKLHLHMHSKGASYESHYYTILKWDKNEEAGVYRNNSKQGDATAGMVDTSKYAKAGIPN
jgi:hypothetical protein